MALRFGARHLVALAAVVGLCMAALAGGAPTSMPVKPAALPEGPGLAAKYPGDLGIDKDPSVLFADNFETGTIQDLNKRYSSIKNPNNEALSWSDDVPDTAAGKRSILMTATLGKNSGGDLYTNFKGVDQAFLRFYVKFAPDFGYEHHFVDLGGYNPPTAWPNPRAGTKPVGNERVEAMIDVVGWYGKYPPPGIWSPYVYWSEMKISADKNYWGNCIGSVVPQQAPRGKWQCVECMIQMNSAPDKRDGRLALWLDGKLVLDVYKGVPRALWSGMGFNLLKEGGEPFEGFLFRTDNALKLNHVWIEHYDDENSQKSNKYTPTSPIQRVWFDDIVVSTTYIGPIQKK